MSAANDKPQIDRFKEAARQLGCDDDKDKFEAALRKVASHKPARPSDRKKEPKGHNHEKR